MGQKNLVKAVTDMPRRGNTVAPPAAGVERKKRRVAALSPTCITKVTSRFKSIKKCRTSERTFELAGSKFVIEPK